MVSGVVDPVRGMAERDRLYEPVDEILRDAEALNRDGLPGVCVYTTGRDPETLAREALLKAGWIS